MPSLLSKPNVITLLAASWLMGVAAGAAQPIFLLDLSDQTVGEAPATARWDASEKNKLPQSLSQIGDNTVRVAEGVGGLEGRALLLEKKDGNTPRTPAVRLVNRPSGITGGVVEISYDAVVTHFAAGERFPGFEALLTLNFYNNDGHIFYTLNQVVGEDRRGGEFRSSAKLRGGSSRWRLGEPVKVAVRMDLTQGLVTVTIDDHVAVENHRLDGAAGQAVRLIEFRDGTAYGAYDGAFTAGLTNLRVVHTQ